ncbi:MAG: zinc-dependent metalloprotease [Mariniblastus sp.]|nr:zinc-dependent metalloprotease [Mariniblastus sp.]
MKKNRKKKTASKLQRQRRRRRDADLARSYELMEPRRVLAAIFPAYVDGTFTLGDPSGASPYQLEDTFELESIPNADKVIYLDFNGHHSVLNAWNHDIVFPAFDRDGDANNFSDAELIEIQKNFQNVSEDFFAFGINVTTKDPGIDYLTKLDNSDTTYGIRVVCTQATDGFGGFGGIAFLNSFDSHLDDPCFALNKGVNVGAMTQSHEVGHTLGLRHDGLDGSAYHPGSGSGETSWGPIMGAPFSANLTQWSPGDYDGSTNTEDDYAVITKSRNGFDFKTDDYGSTLESASPLIVENNTVFMWGNIETQSDVDVFEFTTSRDDVSFELKPFQENPNLDIQATIYDSDGAVVAVSNPADQLDASFNLSLEAGTYFLAVEGVGLPGEYSDYGSIGFYTIEGTVINLFGSDIGEAGHVTINHNWTTVELERTYEDPVVIMGPSSRNGGDVLTVRVNNVTSESFDVRLQEWDYRDGRHVPETVSYIVMEAGEYTLMDGTKLRAGTNESGGRWKTYDLSESIFDSTPMVFSQVMTTNGEEAVTTRIRNASANSFQLRVQEQQANGPQRHVNETVGYLAITPGGSGSESGGNFVYEAGNTGIAVTHKPYQIDFEQTFVEAPVLLTAMQSHTGGDPATVRLRSALSTDSATIFIEEERSHDYEMRHNPEDVGYFAISVGDILGEDEDGDKPPEFIYAPGYKPGFAGMPGYYSTDKPEIWAALAVMESWGDEIVGDHECGCCTDSVSLAGALSDSGSNDYGQADSVSHDDDPCCTCADCMSAIGSELGLTGFVPEGELATTTEEVTEIAAPGIHDRIRNLAGALDLEPSSHHFAFFSSFVSIGEDTTEQELDEVDFFNTMP